MDLLPYFKQWVEEPRCWGSPSNSVKTATDVLQYFKNESAGSMSQEEQMKHQEQPNNEMQKND